MNEVQAVHVASPNPQTVAMPGTGAVPNLWRSGSSRPSLLYPVSILPRVVRVRSKPRENIAVWPAAAARQAHTHTHTHTPAAGDHNLVILYIYLQTASTPVAWLLNQRFFMNTSHNFIRNHKWKRETLYSEQRNILNSNGYIWRLCWHIWRLCMINYVVPLL